MLYVVAWPLLAEADDTALRRLRSQYHPKEADMIGPHFTLVFGAPLERESALRAALGSLICSPIWFVIESIERQDNYLLALPYDGAAMLMELYDQLNPVAERKPFDPHMTLGVFQRPEEAERIARIVGRLHLPIHGRIEELALLRRDGDKLETLVTVPLRQ